MKLKLSLAFTAIFLAMVSCKASQSSLQSAELENSKDTEKKEDSSTGAPTATEETGPKQIILIHGFGRDCRLGCPGDRQRIIRRFREVEQAQQQKIYKYNSVANLEEFLKTGIGETEVHKIIYSDSNNDLDYMVRQAIGQLQKIWDNPAYANKKFTVVAHSMGQYIGLAALARGKDASGAPLTDRVKEFVSLGGVAKGQRTIIPCYQEVYNRSLASLGKCGGALSLIGVVDESKVGTLADNSGYRHHQKLFYEKSTYDRIMSMKHCIMYATADEIITPVNASDLSTFPNAQPGNFVVQSVSFGKPGAGTANHVQLPVHTNPVMPHDLIKNSPEMFALMKATCGI